MKSNKARPFAFGMIFAASALAATAANAAGAYEVQTPSSVNESAPWKAADRPTAQGAIGATQSSASGTVRQPSARTPYPTSVDESRPWILR